MLNLKKCLAIVAFGISSLYPTHVEFTEIIFPQSITKEYKPIYNTIAHKILRIENGDNPSSGVYRTLDEIIDEAKKRIPVKARRSKKEAILALKAIDDILIEKRMVYAITATLTDALTPNNLNEKLIAYIGKNKENLLKNEDIKSKDFCVEDFFGYRENNSKRIANMDVNQKFLFMDCDTQTFIYLAIAQELKLPLKAVAPFGHMLVRWDNDGIHDVYNKNNPVNKGDFLWETTLRKNVSDKEYKVMHKENDDSKLVNLNEKEIFALIYFNLGTKKDDGKNFNEAESLYKQAIAINPFFTEAYINLGNLALQKKDYGKAIIYFDKGISLNPKYALAYYMRGKLLSEVNHFNYAESDLKKAKRLGLENSSKDYCNPRMSEILF